MRHEIMVKLVCVDDETTAYSGYPANRMGVGWHMEVYAGRTWMWAGAVDPDSISEFIYDGLPMLTRGGSVKDHHSLMEIQDLFTNINDQLAVSLRNQLKAGLDSINRARENLRAQGVDV